MRRLILALPLVLAAAPPVEDPSLTPDEAVLKAAKVPNTGAGLLAFLRARYTETTDERIKQLIEQLGDDSWHTREYASEELLRIGVRAKRLLEDARVHEDLEVRWRAGRGLTRLETDGRAVMELTAAAVRQIGRLRPDGAVAVLLECLAAAEDDAIAAEMRSALVAVGVRGEPDPALVRGLTSRNPRVRATVAAALCQARAAAHYAAVKKLFDDTEASVRYAAALGLLEAGRREALAGLIAEVGRPPSREASLAEELLLRVAGDKAPALAGADPAARTKAREAWGRWLKEHGDKTDAEVLVESARMAGVTTVVLLDRGEVVDLDASNRVRFTIEGLNFPLDVQRLPKDRVLVAEHGGDRVTERNAKGEIEWEHRIAAPLSAQRLPNGNTFIANREGLVEIDPKGNEVWAYSRPVGEVIMRARRLPDGDTVMITELGVPRFVRIDRAKRDVAGFGVEVRTSGGRIDLTPEGNVLIPELHNRRVVERSMDGTVVREIKAEEPITALALPGGNVLITSMAQKRAFEVDRSGKEVWEYRRESRVTRAVRP